MGIEKRREERMWQASGRRNQIHSAIWPDSRFIHCTLKYSPNELEASAITTAITCSHRQPQNSSVSPYTHAVHSYAWTFTIDNSTSLQHVHTTDVCTYISIDTMRYFWHSGKHLCVYRTMLQQAATTSYIYIPWAWANHVPFTDHIYDKGLTLGQGRGVLFADPFLCLLPRQHLPGAPLLGTHQPHRTFIPAHRHVKGCCQQINTKGTSVTQQLCHWPSNKEDSPNWIRHFDNNARNECH